jgi:hypothetical protein
MKALIPRFIRGYLKRGETGQAIVVLAIGFIGLLAVVGITTDVSILFARYTHLRRAVDSASIGAAGQLRQDRTIATLNLTARQYIEFHGLNPRNVIVEVCLNYAEKIPDDEVCTDEQRKLVRVTAQVLSPTIFLRLIGFGDIQLQASAIAETAVLDVVIIMNASESMASETTYEDWAEVGMGIAYYPPQLEYMRPGTTSIQNFLDLHGQSVWGRLSSEHGGPVPFGFYATDGGGNTFLIPEPYMIDGEPTPYQNWQDIWFWENYILGRPGSGIPQEVINQRLHYVDIDGTPVDDPPNAGYDEPNNSYYPVYSFIPNGIPAGQVHPREACRVRFYPSAQDVNIHPYMRQLYIDNQGHPNIQPWPNERWVGFVPTYNFHGCCNDPGGNLVDDDGNIIIDPGLQIQSDGNFADLICQPYKQARDATRQFLQRIDFERGDRVAFVNFDRSAFLIMPDGSNPDDPNYQGYTHMIESRGLAIETLNRHMGVRAEPSHYIWNDTVGGWADDTGALQFSQGIDRSTGQPIPIDYFNLDPAIAGEYNDYPVYGNCKFQNAALRYPRGRYAVPAPPGTSPSSPAWIQSGAGTALARINTPNLYSPPWSNLGLNVGAQHITDHSYEMWSQCGGSNVGAGLREANNALVHPETRRTEGAVWIMVMLGDGAAGASDPVRIQGEKPVPPDPYAPTGIIDPATNYPVFGTTGNYGFYGLCPMGLASDPLKLMDPLNRDFPKCSDVDPHTRHTCSIVQGQEPGHPNWGPGFAPGSLDRDGHANPAFTLEEHRQAGNIFDVDIGVYGAPGNPCDYRYDVDDYARDWADWVTGVHPDQDQETATDAVLPTIFTIGFGLTFPDGDGSCAANVEHCLGEELLRYIADVGENWTVNTRYQQLHHARGILDEADREPPSPCEREDVDFWETGEIAMLPPTESCGNYYNAPSQEELERVFDDIASRMFLRLAR